MSTSKINLGAGPDLKLTYLERTFKKLLNLYTINMEKMGSWVSLGPTSEQYFNQQIRGRILWQRREINIGDRLMVGKNNYYWPREYDEVRQPLQTVTSLK